MLTELPERWCVKNTKETNSVLNNWRINIIKYAVHGLPIASYGYFYRNGSSIFNSDKSITEISFEDFKRLVLKENMNKKIIGYKAPIDLFNGTHKKGSIYTFQGKEYGYASHEGSTVPREIVETWEPVYEVQKLQKVGEYEVKYLSTTLVKIGCTEYTKEGLQTAKILLGQKNVEYIGCAGGIKITLDIINQLIESLES